MNKASAGVTSQPIADGFLCGRDGAGPTVVSVLAATVVIVFSPDREPGFTVPRSYGTAGGR
jgi:hypothetical protein